jgi:hypothetical protein
VALSNERHIVQRNERSVSTLSNFLAVISEKIITAALTVANLAVAGLLAWASWPHRRNYYILLRFAVCAVAGVGLYMRKPVWPLIILIGAIIVLFNPLIPFSFAKSTWTKIDLVVAVWFVFAAICDLPIRDSMLGGIALLILSGAIMVSAIYFVGSKIRLSKSGSRTEGEVIEVAEDMVDGGDSNPSGIVYEATYKFVASNGQVITGASKNGGDVGDKVTVIYNPNDPHENQLMQDNLDWPNGLGTILLAGAIAWLIGSSGVSHIRGHALTYTNTHDY